MTILLGLLAVMFGAVAAWAAWKLIEIDRELSHGAPDTDAMEVPKRARHALPLRLRICLSQIRGGNSKKTPPIAINVRQHLGQLSDHAR